MKPIARERDLQAAIRRWLTGQKFLVLKLSMMRQYGSGGWPDLMVLDHAPRTPLFLEVKTGLGSTTPLQNQRMQLLRLRGFHVEIVRSVEGAREAVEEWLR